MPQVATAPRGLVLTCSCVARRRTRLAFPSPSCHPTNALLRSPPRQLCSSWPATSKPLRSPSKSRKRLTVVTSSSSTELDQEPPAIDAERANLPCRLLLPRGSPLTTTIRAPLASPPLQEVPLESIVRPHLHLHRHLPLVRAIAIVHIPSSSPTAARPLW
jgi:hypothetical protein